MKIIPQVICAACAAPLFTTIGDSGTATWTHPITPTTCPHAGQRFIPFDWHTTQAAPPPPGPSILPATPTPPLAPTPSPAGGSNEDMGHADRSNKKPESKPGPETSAKNLPKEKWSLVRAESVLRGEFGESAKVEWVPEASLYHAMTLDAGVGWIVLGAGVTRYEAVCMALRFRRPLTMAEQNPEAYRDAHVPPERVAGLEEVVPMCPPGNPEWVPCAGQCGAYWSDGLAKVGCWYGVGHSGNHSFQEPFLPREKVVDPDVEYWRGLFESRHKELEVLKEQYVFLKAEAERDYLGMRDFQGKYIEADQKWRTAEREWEVLRKRVIEAESELKAVQSKGIEIANESRRTLESLKSAEKDRDAAKSELDGEKRNIQRYRDRLNRAQAELVAGQKAAANLTSACEMWEGKCKEARGKLEAAEKHIEILQGSLAQSNPVEWWNTEWAREKVEQSFRLLGLILTNETLGGEDMKFGLEMLKQLTVSHHLANLIAPAYGHPGLGQKSTRRPAQPREKVRQVQDALQFVTLALALHIMQDRFGSGAFIAAAGPDLENDGHNAVIGVSVWGRGLTCGEAVADAINRWNRGEEAYS